VRLLHEARFSFSSATTPLLVSRHVGPVDLLSSWALLHALRRAVARHDGLRHPCEQCSSAHVMIGVEGNSLWHQCALVHVGFLSFALGSPQPALHLPSASDVPSEETCTDRPAHKNLIDGLVRANSFHWVALSPAAACSGLGSTPDRRARRAFLHLSNSCASPCGPAMLVTHDPKLTLDRLIRAACHTHLLTSF
jgi:hypothetical protein